MKFLVLLSLSTMLFGANAQRGSYAGVRPISNGIKGPFPEQPSGITNRFGEENGLTPQKLPIDALGDANLVNTLLNRPQHQQPFWLLNWQQIEAHREQPQLSGNHLAHRGSFVGRR